MKLMNILLMCLGKLGANSKSRSHFVKVIFFILTFLYGQLTYSQTNSDAIEFLKVNIPNWACETYVQGTFEKRLEISLQENEKYLMMKVKYPSSIGGGYSVCHINLSMITNIYIQRTEGTFCTGIVIQTKPYAIEIDYFNANGQIIKNHLYWNTFCEKNGWIDDSIRIKNSADNANGANRIVKAIKFLAEQNGAVLKESNF